MELTIPQVLFSKPALQKMFKIAQCREHSETGGLVLGNVRNRATGRLLVVKKVTGPGPKARLTAHSFQPDLDF